MSTTEDNASNAVEELSPSARTLRLRPEDQHTLVIDVRQLECLRELCLHAPPMIVRVPPASLRRPDLAVAWTLAGAVLALLLVLFMGPPREPMVAVPCIDSATGLVQ